MTETTHHPAALYAYLGYRDAPAAIEWLGRAIGFETTMAQEWPFSPGYRRTASR